MTQEEAQSYLKTYQLSDYRTDWPDGQKGCLFFVGVDNFEHIRRECFLAIFDFPWREGANWEEYDKLLPFEKKDLIKQNHSVKIATRFGACLLSLMIRGKIDKNFDLNLMWNTYEKQLIEQECFSIYYEKEAVPRTRDDKEKFSRSILKYLKVIGAEHNFDIDLYQAYLKKGLAIWLERYVQQMTPQKQLFENDFSFSVHNCYKEWSLPIWVFDIPYKTETGKIVCDLTEHREDGYMIDVETSASLLLCPYHRPDIRIIYDAPQSCNRYATGFKWNEEEEKYEPTAYIESYNRLSIECEEENISIYGLAALIPFYSAKYKILEAAKNPDKTQAVNLICSKSYFDLESVRFCVTKEVYDLYYDHFHKDYLEIHDNDSDFFTLSEEEKEIIILKAAIEDEQQNLTQSTDIDKYFTPEQSAQLKIDVQNYIKYLQRDLDSKNPTPAVQSSTPQNNPLIAELDTEFIQERLQRLRREGYLDETFHPVKGKCPWSTASSIAKILGENAGLQNFYQVFEAFWNHRDLANNYQGFINKNKKWFDIEEKLMEILK